MKREELPKKILKSNFFVKVPEAPEEDEEGLITEDEESSRVIVAAVAEDCNLEVGDEILMKYGTMPIVAIELVDGFKYAMFTERDVEAIW